MTRFPTEGDGAARRADGTRGVLGTAGGAGAAAGFRLGYRPWLDGLRGLAILAVLACHLAFFPGGFLGVDLFFVLSGFLITALLVQEWQGRGAISLPRFYLRRALRLWPALIVLLAVCGVCSLFVRAPGGAATMRKEILLTACYVTNWPTIHQSPTPTLGHTWSLSIEEQFYVVWPLLLWCLLRGGVPRRWILLLVYTGVLASAALRAVLYARHAADPNWIPHTLRLYLGLDTRADALLIGCLVGLLAAWDLLPKSRRFLVGLGVAALVCAAALGYLFLTAQWNQHPFYYGFFTVVALLVAVILVRLLAAPSRLASRVLEFPPLIGLGRISYAVYLFHVPIIVWLRPTSLGWHRPGKPLLVAGLSVTAAVLSYFCIERPFLRLKGRLHYPGSDPLSIGDVVSTGKRWGETLPPRAAA